MLIIFSMINHYELVAMLTLITPTILRAVIPCGKGAQVSELSAYFLVYRYMQANVVYV